MNFFKRLKQAFKVFREPEKFVDKAVFIDELKQSVKNPEYLPEVLRASVNYAQTTCGFIWFATSKSSTVQRDFFRKINSNYRRLYY